MPSNTDAYSPEKIAELIEATGIKKANLPALQTLVLGTLAGAFIAFGAMFYTVVVTGSELGFGPTRLLGGIAFSLGLILVVVAGAELFTGNNLIVMAWADKKISTRQLLRNWTLVYLANFFGSIASAAIFSASGAMALGDGATATTAYTIVETKMHLSALELFTRGILCNALVCLAVWLSVSSHTVSGKILAILFPISAFVALGFEHSVANMYLFSLVIIDGGGSASWWDLANNLLVVTAGNIIGGSVLVGLVYWLCYIKKSPDPD